MSAIIGIDAADGPLRFDDMIYLGFRFRSPLPLVAVGRSVATWHLRAVATIWEKAFVFQQFGRMALREITFWWAVVFVSYCVFTDIWKCLL